MRKTNVSETGQRILLLSEEEKKVLSDYQASGGNVNIYLRKKFAGEIEHIEGELLEECEREVRGIDAIFKRSDPLPRSLLVYRGLSVEKISPNEFKIPCYVGTTYDPFLTLEEVIKNTNRRIIQEIQLEQGQKAIFIPSYLPFDPFGERELLLPREIYFQILDRELKRNIVVERVKILKQSELK